MFTTNIHLPYSKFKVTCKNAYFECRCNAGEYQRKQTIKNTKSVTPKSLKTTNTGWRRCNGKQMPGTCCTPLPKNKTKQKQKQNRNKNKNQRTKNKQTNKQTNK